MSAVNIPPMTTPFLMLAPRRQSGRRASPVESDRGRKPGGTRGRAWINGREVGGTEARFAHLLGGHD
jgi:hypothetical protein